MCSFASLGTVADETFVTYIRAMVHSSYYDVAQLYLSERFAEIRGARQWRASRRKEETPMGRAHRGDVFFAKNMYSSATRREKEEVVREIVRSAGGGFRI